MKKLIVDVMTGEEKAINMTDVEIANWRKAFEDIHAENLAI